jgi:hypothetical protein
MTATDLSLHGPDGDEWLPPGANTDWVPAPTSAKPSGRTDLPPWLRIAGFIGGNVLAYAGVILGLFYHQLDVASSFLTAIVGIALIAAATSDELGDAFGRYASEIRERIGDSRLNISIENDGVVHLHSQDLDPATVRASDSLEKQEAILREIYTQGLAQARRSFTVSLFFACVGAIFLLGGVGLAISNAKNGGQQYASVVSGTAGVVINLTSGLFFVQSNRARQNMGQQGVMLREESREDRKLNAARELAGAISDEKLRNQVRADLARRLVDVTISEEQKGPPTSEGRDDSGDPGDD